MNELLGLKQLAAQKRMDILVNPPEPVQSSTKKLEVQLDRFSAVSKQKGSLKKRFIQIPSQRFLNRLQKGGVDDPDKEKKRLIQQYQKEESDRLDNELGYRFKEKDTFNCTQYIESVFSQVNVDDLLASKSQNIETLNKELDRDVTKLPPTAETIVRFYVHEIPDASDGMDLILIGGGGSEALGNVGFAAQARDVLDDPTLQGKVRRIIILPHLAGSTRTATPVDPAHTKDFGPSADILLQALEQASVRLSNNICLIGHSAGANQAIMLADRLVDKQLKPRLVLLEPAIGENPNIVANMITTGFTNPYSYARREREIELGDTKETIKATTRAQALANTLNIVLEGWGTTEGPARWGIIKELLRNPTRTPLPYMKSEAKAAGIGDEYADANPVIEILATDSTKMTREKLAALGVPISVTWMNGATVVDRQEERLRENYREIEKNQEFYYARAKRDFPNALVSPEVHVEEGGNHFIPMWNSQVLRRALASVL